MSIGRIIGCCAMLVSLSFAEVLAGDDSAFTNKLALGLTMTDGNNRTMQMNASLISEKEKEGLGSVRAGIEANYGTTTVEKETTDISGAPAVIDEDSTTIDNAKIFANVKRTINDLFFGYVDGSSLYDDIAFIDYRTTFGPGFGVYLIKDSKCSLSTEAGPSYIWEKVSDLNDSYLALRVAERFTYKINDNANVWQSLEYLPKTTDFVDYLLNCEVGAESAISQSLSLRIVMQNKYDSIPGEDLEKSDLTLIAGIAVTI